MKAVEAPLVRLLEGTKQFLIPIYQRRYSWTRGHCEQLWKDIQRAARNADVRAHFIGSVVYVEQSIYSASSLRRLLVIDGQQRLTTFTLLVEALARHLSKLEEEKQGLEDISSRKLRNYFLFNAEEGGDDHFKLLLSRGDTDTLRAILRSSPMPLEPAANLLDNLAYFEERVADGSVPLALLYRGLIKLLVVDISLDRQHDNPQLIFESLNSTGLDLSQSDLIRNYVLMGLEPEHQERLYLDFWYPMEQRFVGESEAGAFDHFLRAWLTIRLGVVTKTERIYEEFKLYRSSHPDRGIDEVVTDLHRFAGHYAAIAMGEETDGELRAVFRDLRELRTEVAVSFLMDCYDRWKADALSKADLVQVARLVEAWIVRRAICAIPSNVLSRTFANLMGHLDPDHLLESFQAWLLSRTTRQRFPNDEEYAAGLSTCNLYESRLRTYFLSKLENHGRKERVEVADWTVEHVLPQNEHLSAKWQQELGPNWKVVRERWLHTLANLTLTGYNSELSDRSFREKRDMEGGFRNSPIRLNRGLAGLECFGEDELEQRGRDLAEMALEVWPSPKLSENALHDYRVSQARKSQGEYTLDDYHHLTGWLLDLYLRMVERLRSWDPRICESFKQQYIGFRLPECGKQNIAWVRPAPDQMLLGISIPYERVESPPPWCQAPATDGWERRSRVLVRLQSESQLEDVVRIIRAAAAYRRLKSFHAAD